MDINEAAHIGAAEQRAAENTVASSAGGVARRRLLLAGASGTAFSLLPFVFGRAAAAAPAADGTDATEETTADSGDPASDVTTGGSTVETEPATTTTAPPKRPTEEDIELLAFVQMIEFAARDLYEVAINAEVFSGATLEAVKAIAENHEAYAQTISGMIGRSAPNTANAELFDALETDFGGDLESVALAARDLENNLVATHTDVIGRLVGIDASASIASIVVIEARHATVMAHLAGTDDLDEQLATEGAAIAPTAAPAQ